MSVSFTLASKPSIDVFRDTASEGDTKTYEFDLTAWQEENSTVTDVTWTVEGGTASISNEQLSAGTASALINFSSKTKTLISILITTANETKKLWLDVSVKKLTTFSGGDDYGFCS